MKYLTWHYYHCTGSWPPKTDGMYPYYEKFTLYGSAESYTANSVTTK